MRARRIDEEEQRFLLGSAQDHAVGGGDRVLLVGLTTVGAVVRLAAGTRPDVLSLMAFSGRALPNLEAAVLAEIIAPGIAIVRAAAFVEDQRAAVHLAHVRCALRAHAARAAAGEIAIAPIVEALRIGESGRLASRETQIGIDRAV